MERDARIKEGSVVQVNENFKHWAGCLLIVKEIKSFGVTAYMHIPFDGDAFIRLTWNQIEYIGEAELVSAR